MDLSKDDILKIIKIIEEASYDEVRLEVGDFKLHVQKQGAQSRSSGLDRAESPAPVREPTPQRPPAPPAPASAPAAEQKPQAEVIPEGLSAVRAPMLGTFYRAPSPGEKPFVEQGQRVEPDTIVCLVEVMKLFNSVKAGVAGTVVKVLAENAAMVEYGEALLLIDPGPAAAHGR
jgi:acetyl-CoA carboxylase biotin carboxyl carrier protein